MATLDVISLDDAMTAISMTGSGANHAEQVETFISGVSQRMDALCGPIVQREITDEVYTPSGSLIILKSQPVVEVTELTEYVSGTGTVLTGEDLTTSGGWLLRDGMLSRRSGFSTINWYGTVAVTYTAGRYETTEDVDGLFRLAAQQIIARMWPQYASAWSRGAGVFDAPEGSVGFFRSFDPVLQELLAHELLPPSVA